ncbi:beta-galactosidase [Neobacillus dielmonensis]|uniref:beta-galactosidase n=1 Tax=Neobacillus dielmonensis TaxID=1347369 RepID=UPI0005A9C0CA|nr:beta-galactosidase [Neobacillus dielmonensis]
MSLYKVNLEGVKKEIYSGHLQMGGSNPQGEEISFSNYYMMVNGKPYFGIVGEFHYGRYPYRYWEESIRKIKAGGVNLLASYVIWNYHEEEEGQFDWTENNNLRYFVNLCGRNDMKVILRIGPFAHGEVRNGGIPDWLYGRPFDIRSNDPEYLHYAKRWYDEIGRQVQGLLYKDGGPIVGIQLENEYMHAGAPWELAYKQGTYMTAGRDGAAHLIELKKLATGAGLIPAYFTGTAWGGAAIIEHNMLPMLAGYAFTPWNPDENYVQPPTKEFLFRDLHTNQNDNNEYQQNDYPLAYCEMGGGIQITYNHRPVVPPESVEAMTVVKIGSGSNLVGYYMYHGGSNRIGKHGYMNEFTVPKISYDFQAPIREFGQLADSYRYLRSLFMFLHEFGDQLAPGKTVVPYNPEKIQPENTKDLRYSTRVHNDSGFIFLNNYQDHVEMRDMKDIEFELKLNNETLVFPYHGGMTLKKNKCAILPFNLDLNGLTLNYSTCQPLTKLDLDWGAHYFFYEHQGMGAEYCFKEAQLGNYECLGADIVQVAGKVIIKTISGLDTEIVLTGPVGKKVKITTLTREQALNSIKLDLWGQNRLFISKADLTLSNGNLEVVSRNHRISLDVYPGVTHDLKLSRGICIKGKTGIFDQYEIEQVKKEVQLKTRKAGDHRLVIEFGHDLLDGLNDVFLEIDYVGDTGNAFIDGKLINDHFYNGLQWEIGLKRFESEIINKGMYLFISPLRKGKMIKHVNQAYVETFDGEEIANIRDVRAIPEYKVLASI